MLTRNGYKLEKSAISDITKLKRELTVKPNIPAVFVQPQYVKKYPVYSETENFLYVPKQFGISRFGPAESDMVAVASDRWEFTGSLRPLQVDVVSKYTRDGMICLQTGGGKTVCALYIASTLKLKSLIVVHNTFLKDQWEDRIKAFLPKARIAMLNDDESCDITIRDFTLRTCKDGSVKYKNGEKHGDWYAYHPGGRLIAVSNQYKKGMRKTYLLKISQIN